MSAKVISLIDYKIRKATEEAERNAKQKTQLPLEIVVQSTSIDFISKLIRLGYKATHRDGYCYLRKSKEPGGIA